jgi:hypothetical protein
MKVRVVSTAGHGLRGIAIDLQYGAIEDMCRELYPRFQSPCRYLTFEFQLVSSSSQCVQCDELTLYIINRNAVNPSVDEMTENASKRRKPYKINNCK